MNKSAISLHMLTFMQLQVLFLFCGLAPPKTDGSWWRGLTECGPLEKGMANHFSILALRTHEQYEKAK